MLRITSNSTSTHVYSCSDVDNAKKVSGLVRTALSDESSDTKTTTFDMVVPDKYNFPEIAHFLETTTVDLSHCDLADLARIINAANYWDIPQLLEHCMRIVVRSNRIPSKTTVCTTDQRRQFIDLVHSK